MMTVFKITSKISLFNVVDTYIGNLLKLNKNDAVAKQLLPGSIKSKILSYFSIYRLYS